MLLPAFEYVRPASVDDAVAALSAGRNARVLAGGQTMLNALKLRVVHPDVLVDVGALEDLRRITVDEDGSVRIGAAVTYDEAAASPVLGEHHPDAAQMTSRLVDRMVRSRGTVGGNVCLADPTSNWPPLVVALGATLRVRSAAGVRDVPADSFFVAPYVTAVGPGELLEEVVLPALAERQGVGYESVQLGTDSWALARACAVVRRDGDGAIAEARVVLGCGDVPVRQPALEAELVGGPPSPERVTAAVGEHAGEDFDPPADVHASSEFRRHLATVVARRAVMAACRRPEDNERS